MDLLPTDLQRRALAHFATALGSADVATRRDACGDPVIIGTTGHIYATPDGWQIIAETSTGRAWSAVKRRLAFATLLRNGDTEGAFHLDFLPDPEQAAEIRSALGIRKRPAMTAEQRVAMVNRLDAAELVDLATVPFLPQPKLERSYSTSR